MNDTLTLESKDGTKLTIDKESINKSGLIKGLVNDFEDSVIPITDVPTDILKKCIDYLTHFKASNPSDIPRPLPSNSLGDVVSTWELEFIDSLSMTALFDIVKAANYLDIKPLLCLSCAKIATFMKGKTAEEIRKTFNIENDLTEEDVKDYEEFQI